MPPRQGIPSPTPGPDGRIIYIVKAGDTCEGIAATYNVSLAYLRTTNLLNENCDIREGQALLLGIGGPSVATPTPGVLPTPVAATPTPTLSVGGSTTICVFVYDDVNGDGLHQEGEKTVAGAALSLANAEESYSRLATTAINPDPEAYPGICFEEVPPGEYTVSAAAPIGYNPTTGMTSLLQVIPGDTAYVNFGVQAQVVVEKIIEEEEERASPLLGVLGLAFLLSALGLGIYAWRIMRRR